MKVDREIRRIAKELGFTLSATKRDHVKAVRPGSQPVFMASTPSDHRSKKNAIAMLRRVAAGRPA